jgi:uncharacterized protein with ATP-grasp and redox domains
LKTYLECVPCFLRQALDAAKLAGADKKTQKKVLDDVARMLPGFSLDVTPPEIARTVYGIVESHTEGKDAYKKVKKKSNDMAMELYPRLKKVVEASSDVLLSAVRLAVAGNVIDYGVPQSFDIEREIEECLERDFAIFDFKEFKSAVKNASNILYLLDNAGEIVFDRILIEEMDKSIVCAVRGKPIINDVTMDDAREVGLDKVARVISSSSDIPGTVVQRCSKEFLGYYDNADVVISKGQGNFETLADEDKTIFFIFKAKCSVVAEHVGCREGDIILKKQRI